MAKLRLIDFDTLTEEERATLAALARKARPNAEQRRAFALLRKRWKAAA